METIYHELLQQQNVRSNLSIFRQKIKESGAAARAKQLVADKSELFLSFLDSEDAKTRKNAALLLGDVCYEPAAAALFAHYEQEQTLFVRSAYLQALDTMDVSQMLPDLRDHQKKLQEQELTEENRKHVEEELRALRKILIRCDGITHHTFDMRQKNHQVLLVTNRNHREVVRRMAGMGKVHPLGVFVETEDLLSLLQVRTYRDMLFPMGERVFLSADPAEAAKEIAPWMLALCQRYHKEPEEFYFRVECKGRLSLEERSSLTKKLGSRLELLTGGALVNSPGDYEVELRLIENKEGKFFPCLKFFTLPDRRFAYRKHAISASIHPSLAALLMELARPYLKENAQIMDPFCGVGTMLIERDIAVPAKEKYATDIYGDAIEMGRKNAASAGTAINFIHRDFFDFHHTYLFDEIITNMPYRGKKTKEEMDRLYDRFFEQALNILQREAVIVMYTNEVAFVKKQLRLHRECSLLQETCIKDKTGFYLMIIGVKREQNG